MKHNTAININTNDQYDHDTGVIKEIMTEMSIILSGSVEYTEDIYVVSDQFGHCSILKIGWGG